MTRLLFCLMLLAFVNKSVSQINFEKGYFINNSGKRVECFIKNRDWIKSPKEFKYKILLTDETLVEKTENVIEFGITNVSKYLRVELNIDKSTSVDSKMAFDANTLSEIEKPELVKEFVILKLIVPGRANLYYFEDSNRKRFFYNIDNSIIQELIYKDYSPDGVRVLTNRGFQKQLYENLRCENNKNIIVERMAYTINEFEKYFIAFNSCYQ